MCGVREGSNFICFPRADNSCFRHRCVGLDVCLRAPQRWLSHRPVSTRVQARFRLAPGALALSQQGRLRLSEAPLPHSTHLFSYRIISAILSPLLYRIHLKISLSSYTHTRARARTRDSVWILVRPTPTVWRTLTHCCIVLPDKNMSALASFKKILSWSPARVSAVFSHLFPDSLIFDVSWYIFQNYIC